MLCSLCGHAEATPDHSLCEPCAGMIRRLLAINVPDVCVIEKQSGEVACFQCGKVVRDCCHRKARNGA